MGHISFVGKGDADTPAGGGARDRAGLDARPDGDHSMDFWLTSEDLPDPENRGARPGRQHFARYTRTTKRATAGSSTSSST